MISEEELASILPVWDKINKKTKESLVKNFRKAGFAAGSSLINKSNVAFFIVKKGSVRVFSDSENGEEVFLYRIAKDDGCIVSDEPTYTFASQTELFYLDHIGYENALTSAQCAGYFLQIVKRQEEKMLSQFNLVMFTSVDSRLRDFLLTASSRSKDKCVKYTHEQIAGFIGTSREVVTRKLKILQEDGAVEISRGKVFIVNREELKKKK